MGRDSSPNRFVLSASLPSVLLMAVGCGDDGTQPTDLGDLSAVWVLSTTITADACGSSTGSTTTDNIILIQCGNTVSIIARGMWGSAVVLNDELILTGTETRTDEEGCKATHRSSGTLSGRADRLQGTISTNVTFDPGSCGALSACTLEASWVLRNPFPYRSSCIERDQFGSPAASQYVLPYPVGESYVLNNSYCIPTGGHREQLAYDFLIPIGDPVTAARSGIVRVVKDDSPDDGQGTDHNHVVIEHDDGTAGFYAHLKQGSAQVMVGESIAAGQMIALAGHSGTPDVPHLHFGVYASYPGVEGNDRAVNFRNADGPVDCRGGLVWGAAYTAHD